MNLHQNKFYIILPYTIHDILFYIIYISEQVTNLDPSHYIEKPETTLCCKQGLLTKAQKFHFVTKSSFK